MVIKKAPENRSFLVNRDIIIFPELFSCGDYNTINKRACFRIPQMIITKKTRKTI